MLSGRFSQQDPLILILASCLLNQLRNCRNPGPFAWLRNCAWRAQKFGTGMAALAGILPEDSV